jgi:hypothetical protein
MHAMDDFATRATPLLEAQLSPGEKLKLMMTRGGTKLLGGDIQRDGVAALVPLRRYPDTAYRATGTFLRTRRAPGALRGGRRGRARARASSA